MSGKPSTIALRIYRLLLIAYPGEFRRQYGPQMTQVFQDRCVEEQRRGVTGLLRLWMHTLSDWAATVPAEHLDVLSQDLRYGVRTLTKSPGFTAVAVLSLALGIGATTAIFSVVNAVLLRPLPFKDPGRLVGVWEFDRQDKRLMCASQANFVDWREQNRVFEDMAALHESYPVNITAGEMPERVEGARVSTNFFPLLGIEAVAGRTFLPGEDGPGAERVVVVSPGLWQRRFGSTASEARFEPGRTLTLDGASFAVVGILPRGFQFLNPDAELWVPFAPNPIQRSARWVYVVARLKPGLAIQQAQAGLETVARRLEKEYPKTNAGFGVNLQPLQEVLAGEVGQRLLLLLGAVSLVLLIACANVANILLARGAARQREIAIRTALGAGQSRLIRQLLTESLLLALLGGALGLLLAVWGLHSLLALGTDNIPRFRQIGIDGWVLGFTFAISVLTGLLFGTGPALRISRPGALPSLNQSLKEGVRRLAGGLRGGRIRNLLVPSEVALALVLLTGAGLMINSFLRLTGVDPGFNPKNLLTMQFFLPRAKYTDDAGLWRGETRLRKIKPQQEVFIQRLIERLESLPGVHSAAATNFLPLDGWSQARQFRIAGRPSLPGGAQQPWAEYRIVSPKYFQAMGIPLLKGRPFTGQDTKGAPGVVIINETMARRFWPNENPVGRHLSITDYGGLDEKPCEIVGVAGDVRQYSLARAPIPEMYIPFPQQPRIYQSYFDRGRLTLSFVVRAASNPEALSTAVERAVREVDPDQPVYKIAPMEQVLANLVSGHRFYMSLLGLFSLLGLALAAVGIYGVTSYSVAQRTHEIGVRRALGAQKSDVLKLVVRQGMILTLIGLVLGLAGAVAATRVLSSLLYGVKPTDPLTFAGVALLFAAAALAASYIPARRATQVDPIIALRYE